MASSPSPILSGIRGRCGACGEGKLFKSFLTLNDRCPSCGRDMSAADTADGPAFFVGFGVLILLAPFLFLLPMMEISVMLKIVGFAVICAAIIGLSLIFLPMVKGILLNLQLHHAAEEATFDHKDN